MVCKIKIYSIGKTKEKWLDLALEEYEKRLSPNLSLEWILAKDDPQLEQSLRKESHFICLDPQGRSFSSPEFSAFLAEAFEKQGSRLSFVIGGPKGLSPQLLAQASHTISFSKLTFTHQIIRLILAEQLYRSLQIQRGTKYHK